MNIQDMRNIKNIIVKEKNIMVDYYNLNVSEAIKSLKSSEKGLTKKTEISAR